MTSFQIEDHAKGPEIMRRGYGYERKHWLRRNGDKDFIYFAEAFDANAVKIGVTKDPLGRVKDLQCGSPHELYLLLVVEGGQREEQLLHRDWAKFRIRGEWFRLEDKLRTFIWSQASAWPFWCEVDKDRKLEESKNAKSNIA